MQNQSPITLTDWGFFINNQTIMARQDINVDAVYGELNTTDNLTSKTIYSFIFLGEVDGKNNDDYCYAEITVPPNFEMRYKDDNGIHVKIPYTPEFKELMVRLRIEDGTDHIEYVLNKSNNMIWYPVYSKNKSTIKIRSLNENYDFNLILRDGYMELFSGHETDLIIKASMGQNESFLLKASAGSLYQYPTTGVGLLDYLHANFENTGLAQKLQSEFINDKMIIDNAYMDSTTGELHLNVREKDG